MRSGGSSHQSNKIPEAQSVAISLWTSIAPALGTSVGTRYHVFATSFQLYEYHVQSFTRGPSPLNYLHTPANLSNRLHQTQTITLPPSPLAPPPPPSHRHRHLHLHTRPVSFPFPSSSNHTRSPFPIPQLHLSIPPKSTTRSSVCSPTAALSQIATTTSLAASEKSGQARGG